MGAYRHYWFLTVALLSAAIFGIYEGIVPWLMEKFPDTTTRAALGVVLIVLVWTFVRRGHGTAWMIGRNERALQMLTNSQSLAPCEARELLEEAIMLRDEGKAVGQTDFSYLHSRQVSYFEEAMSVGIDAIEKTGFLLFLAGVILAFLALVTALTGAVLPHLVEDLSPFMFGLLKSLGRAYVPGLACVASFMILVELGSVLRVNMGTMIKRFDGAAYRVTIIGRSIDTSLIEEAERHV